MKKVFRKLALFLMCALFMSVAAFSQDLPCAIGPKTIRAFSVVNSNSICLVCPTNDYRQQLRISRRVYTNHPGAWQNWVEVYAISNPVVAKAASTYCDPNVIRGIHYEYRISALVTNWVCGGTINESAWYYQYISTGTAVPLRDQRGKVVLLVESSLTAPLAIEIARLEQDLIGDGYQVFRHDVAASEVTAPNWKTNVANTKFLIRANYNTDTNADWNIFIVGHVPIPYSALNSPGSHTENYGAHPADWYYADMNETGWTDTTASNTSAVYPSNWNIPGDGKFDQNTPPSVPELRIGRLDLVNMPAFGKSEVELMRQYLDRNHAWRHKQFTARDRGMVNASGTPFESHNSYSSLFGGVTNADVVSWLSVATNVENSYLMAASYGSGNFTRDNQLGATEDFAARPLYAVFTSMYGSYYGDWDSAMHPNVVLKAPLAAEGYALTSYYRRWVNVIDAACMDEAIGYETYAMAANQFFNFSARYYQYARVTTGGTFTSSATIDNYTTLMGDPTLRLRMVAPPTNVTVSSDGTDNVISWTAAVDTDVQGYHVYRAPMTNLNGFTRRTSSLGTTGAFRDVNAATGAYLYMVRTVKLEQSANRSYYNASQGIFSTSQPRLTATFSAVNGRILLISGQSGQHYTVENTTNLGNVTAWQPLTNITLSGPTGTVSLANTNPLILYRLKR